MLGQQLPQWDVTVYVCMLFSCSWINSVAHQLSHFAVGFFTVFNYWGLVSLPHLISLGQGQWSLSWSPAVSVLWWFADYFSVLQCTLTLDVAHCSGDKFCGPLPALFQAAAYHPTTVGPSAFPAFVYWKFMWRSAPCLSPLLQCAVCFQQLHPSAMLVFIVFSSLFIVQVFLLLFVGGSVCPGGSAGLSQGWLREYRMMLGAHLFDLPNVSQQAWSWCLVACLPSKFGAGIWWWRQPPVFSV
jgi:hypothetical protein